MKWLAQGHLAWEWWNRDENLQFLFWRFASFHRDHSDPIFQTKNWMQTACHGSRRQYVAVEGANK